MEVASRLTESRGIVGKRRADGERCCWAVLGCAVPHALGWARLHGLCRMGRCRQDDDDLGMARAGMVCAGIARAAGLVQTRLSGCRLTLSIEGRAGDPARVLSLTANVGPSLPCAAVPPPPTAPLLVEVGTKRGPPVVVCSLPPAKLSPPRDASFRHPSTDPDVRLQASCLSKPLCNASTGESVCSGRHSISSPPPFAP